LKKGYKQCLEKKPKETPIDPRCDQKLLKKAQDLFTARNLTDFKSVELAIFLEQ